MPLLVIMKRKKLLKMSLACWLLLRCSSRYYDIGEMCPAYKENLNFSRFFVHNLFTA